MLLYRRGDGPAAITVMINISGVPVPLPPHGEIVVTSAPVSGGVLPPDTAAWLR